MIDIHFTKISIVQTERLIEIGFKSVLLNESSFGALWSPCWRNLTLEGIYTKSYACRPASVGAPSVRVNECAGSFTTAKI